MSSWTRTDAPTNGKRPIEPTFEELLNNRVQRAIDGQVIILREQIDALRAELESRRPVRWPARMSRSDAAAYLGVSPSWLDELVRRGLVCFVLLPGLDHRSYLKSDLDEYLAQATVPAPDGAAETAAK